MKLKNRTVLAVACFALLCAGCAETPDSFKKATEACAKFGGLKYHYLWPWQEWHCMDGTVINTLGT